MIDRSSSRLMHSMLFRSYLRDRSKLFYLIFDAAYALQRTELGSKRYRVEICSAVFCLEQEAISDVQCTEQCANCTTVKDVYSQVPCIL